MLFLVSTAFALTIPVRATLHETVEPGERPGAGGAATASVAVSHAEKGVAYKVTADELYASRREAAGAVDITFTADPSGSVRTWAIYPLDGNGKLLAEPSVVEVSFDNNCTGAMSGRKANARATDPTSITVACEEGAIAGMQVAHLGVGMLDAGVDASFVGVAELGASAGTGELADAPDMSVMDATVYAAYQSLDLDAILALTDFRVRLDGNLAVEGLSVASDGTVEGGAELAWDVTFYADTACTGEKCTATAIEALTFVEPVGAVKKRATTAPRVTLDAKDLTWDVWSGGTAIDFAGDVRGLALAASADAWEGEKLIASSDVVALDPSSLGVAARGIGKGPFSGMALKCADLIAASARGVVVGYHTCSMAPTPATLEGRASTWTGTCTRDDESEVRRIVATATADGVSYDVEMGGSAFAAETTTKTCDKSGACTETTDSATGGTISITDDEGTASAKMEVTDTTYDLGFAWKEDVTGLSASLYVEIDTPDSPKMTWAAQDDTLVGSLDGEEVMTVEVLGLQATERCDLGGAEVTLAAAGATIQTRGTGPGTYRCKCKTGFKGDGGC